MKICATPKCTTSSRDHYPRRGACGQPAPFKEMMPWLGAVGNFVWPAWDLNLRPPAPETKALPLDQLAGPWKSSYICAIDTILVNLRSSRFKVDSSHQNVPKPWLTVWCTIITNLLFIIDKCDFHEGLDQKKRVLY